MEMLAACIPHASNNTGLTYPRRRAQSLSTWYIGLPDDGLQFLKEEVTSDAICNIYVKKICYNSTLSDRSRTSRSSWSWLKRSSSAFYDEHSDDTGKAQLQWKLEEVRVIRYATVECLIENLASDNGEIDSSYANTFLATYRTFTSTAYALNHLLNWCKSCSEDVKKTQAQKEGCRKSIRTVVSLWLEVYSDDFCEPPSYTLLRHLHSFARHYMADSELAQRCSDRIVFFQKSEREARCASAEDISLDFNIGSLAISNSIPVLTSDSSSYSEWPSLLETVSCQTFAEQLTYKDAELFRKLVPYQCLGSVWSRRHDSKAHADQVASVYATINQFNAVSRHVVAMVLQRNLSFEERAGIIDRWIDVAQELRLLKNFSSLKAIISGLQSSSVYRLRRTWLLVGRTKNILFQELAQIFSDDDNQRICREVLNREGTAKYADPRSVSVINGVKTAQNSCLQLWPRRMSTVPEKTAAIGTVPYLGTFLTDLMMIDSALKDTHERNDKLINFEKRRKEFEILTQIKLFQSAAGLYRIAYNPEFHRKFSDLHVYDDNESYAISCEIEPDAPSSVEKQVKRHRREASLGFFQPRGHRMKASSECDQAPLAPAVGCWPVAADVLDKQSIHSCQNALVSSCSRAFPVKSRPALRHCSSVGSIGSRMSDRSSRKSGRFSACQAVESVVARVYLQTTNADSSNHYKSILLQNCDRTAAVLQKALVKYDIEESSEHFTLCSVLPDNSEFELPDDVNVFYAVNTQCQLVRFVVRRRTCLPTKYRAKPS